MQNTIVDLLKQYSSRRRRPDGSTYQALLLADELKIANELNLGTKTVQIEALRHNIIPERYSRNQRSLSNEDQIKLLQAHVGIVGQGGLGGTVTEILARIGIGRLTLVDGDVFEESNLNRQLLSSTGNLGMQKVEAARERVAAINPAIEVSVVSKFLTDDNAEKILKGCTVAVDCLDSIPSRFSLEKGCRSLDIPLVYAAIGGTAGQATVIFPGDAGLRQIYGDPQKVPAKGAETRWGTLPYAAMLMAAIECAETVTLLCRKTSQLHKTLLIVNTGDHSCEKISWT